MHVVRYQTYYYGGVCTDPSGILTYTGYLQIQGVSSNNTCSAPSSLTLVMSSFPSDDPFVALLGIEFDSCYQNNPTSLTLNWTDTSGYGFTQNLSVPLISIKGSEYNSFILQYSSGEWSVEDASQPFYLVTGPFINNRRTIGTDSSGNYGLWQSSCTYLSYEKFVQISTLQPSLTKLYISFPSPFPVTTTTSTSLVLIETAYYEIWLYLANPGTGTYQGPFNTDTLYYCNNNGTYTWSTTSC